MALNDVYRMDVEWLQPGNALAQNVFHFIQRDGAGTQAPDAILDAMVAQLEVAWANIAANVSDQVVCQEARLSLWDPVAMEMNQVAVDNPANLDGTDVSAMSDQFVAPVVSFVTEVANRVAKKFLFGVEEAVVLDGVLTAAFIVNLLGYASDLVVDVVVSTDTYRYGTFNTITEVFAQRTGAFSVNPLVSHQVRRRIGRGA